MSLKKEQRRKAKRLYKRDLVRRCFQSLGLQGRRPAQWIVHAEVKKRLDAGVMEDNLVCMARFLGENKLNSHEMIEKYVGPVGVKREPARRTRMPLPPRHPDYKKDENFYLSREWRELRYLALKLAEGRCQCCGAGGQGTQLHVDHIKPRYTHPDLSLTLSNLQVLCADCNIGKGAWDDTDWRSHFKSI